MSAPDAAANGTHPAREGVPGEAEQPVPGRASSPDGAANETDTAQEGVTGATQQSEPSRASAPDAAANQAAGTEAEAVTTHAEERASAQEGVTGTAQQPGPSRASALEGIVIADFSRVLAAPYATMVLGDLGAEVVKVEQPGRGDETRTWGPPHFEGEATYFLSVNRNKMSVQIDLSTRAGREQARELIARADVVVENFKPGTMKKFGLDYESLGRDDLVYCSISGFGSGKGADLPGYDLLVQAVGGLMSMTGPGPYEPVKTGVALVDVLTGLHACVGILAALRHREATGQGQLVELDLLSVLLSSMVNQSAGFTLAGSIPKPMGNRHPSIAPYEVFPTADQPMVLAVGNDRQFRRLCSVLDVPELATDERFVTNSARVEHVDELFEVLSARLRTRPAQHWFETLTPLGVPCGPVNDIAHAFALAESLDLNPTATIGDMTLVANPIRLSRTPVTYRLRPPKLEQ